MPGKYEGLLEQDYWEEIKQDRSPTTQQRAKTWGKDFLKVFRSTSPKPPALLSPPPPPPPSKKGHSRTAYLDGLRGFAAFLVYWHHHQLWAHDGNKGSSILENAFGYESRYHFACFHGIRTFFTGGHFAVTVFFTISGYVLSAKSLSLIQSNEYVKLGDTLASAFFRRWLRLYIPIICTTLIFLTSFHAFGIKTQVVDAMPTYREELWKWYTEFKNFSFIFRTGGDPWFTYNFHVWSIPVEFKGSIVIYTALAAFSRCSRNARLWCEVGLVFYFMYITDAAHCAMFVAGMLLCDLDLLAQRNNLPRVITRLESFKELIFVQFFILGIYLGGVPSHGIEQEVLKTSPGWYYLSFLKPQAVYDYKWFYLFWAAVFIVSSIPRIPWIKRFFELPFNQYLGRISFALYLVHGPMLWIVGDRFYAATGWVRDTHTDMIPFWVHRFPLPMSGPLGLEVSFLVPHIILLPATLCMAEIVTRLFDEPSVTFASWLYRKTLPPVKH